MKAIGYMILGAVLLAGAVKGWQLLTASSEYEPSASEVPLRVDFEQAAATRVQPHNYRQELTHIERELIQLERAE